MITKLNKNLWFIVDMPDYVDDTNIPDKIKEIAIDNFISDGAKVLYYYIFYPEGEIFEFKSLAKKLDITVGTLIKRFMELVDFDYISVHDVTKEEVKNNMYLSNINTHQSIENIKIITIKFPELIIEENK